jgi:hypothetical protein
MHACARLSCTPFLQVACAEHTGDELEAHTTEPANMRISLQVCLKAQGLRACALLAWEPALASNSAAHACADPPCACACVCRLPVLQDACTDHNSTDQAPTTLKEARDTGGVVIVTLKTTNKKTTTDETTEQPTKTAEEIDIDNQEHAEEAPNQEIPDNQEHPEEPPAGSWGDTIGNGWPTFVAHKLNCFSLLPFHMSKTHITLEVGLCGCLLSGDHTASRVTFFKAPAGAVMGDQLELAVEAVHGVNGRFSYNYHLLEHHWAAPHADKDLPATPCHEIQRARQYAIKIARISADCW